MTRLLCILCLCAFLLPAIAAPVTDAQVNQEIQRLQKTLLSAQNPDGSWTYNSYDVGITALVLQALLRSGMDPNDPAIKKAATFINNNTDMQVYSEGLVPCALELLDHDTYRKRMQDSMAFLHAAQTPHGGWSYKNGAGGAGDNSNAQFAVLGIAAAERCGVKVPDIVRERAINHWRQSHNNGGWGYTPSSNPTLSMTCAGLASLNQLGVETNTKRQCCGPYQKDTQIDEGLKWLVSNLGGGKADQALKAVGGHPFYALYAVERVGIFYGIKTFDDLDWYRWGATRIIRNPPGARDIANSAFCLLFLARGSAPIALAKWHWSGKDWDNQKDDVRNWAAYSSEDLHKRLDWLKAPLNNFNSPAAKASLIFVSGSGKFTVTAQELDVLRAFLDLDGTLVAEPTCNATDFYDSFREVILKRLCPQYQPTFVPVDESHPICSSHFQLTPEDVSALEFRAGCKQYRIILLNKPISCALTGAVDSKADLPRARKVATNLLAWSMQRKKADLKLDNVALKPEADQVQSLTIDQIKRQAAVHGRKFHQPFGRLRHRGQWLAAPLFFTDLNQQLSQRPDLVQFDGEIYVSPVGNDLFQAAVLFMTGYEPPLLREDEYVPLRTYLQNGGYLFATSACTSKTFDEGFRVLMQKVLPNDKLEVIPMDDPIWTVAFNLPAQKVQGTAAYHEIFHDKWAPLLGIRREGRWVVVYSPIDLCTDITDRLHDRVVGYRRESAFPLTVNILHYAFTP